MKKTKNLIHATTFILLVAFWSSCTVNRTYFVQRSQIERAGGDDSIPAIRTENQVRHSDTFIKRGLVTWNSTNANKRCLHHLDNTSSGMTPGTNSETCVELEEVTFYKHKVGHTIMLIGLTLILMGAGELLWGDCHNKGECKDLGEALAPYAMLGLGGVLIFPIGGMLAIGSTPDSPETVSPSTGFPERVGSTQGPSLGLQYQTSF